MQNPTITKNNIRTKKPKNIAEGQCYDLLESKGWTPTKKGWPDFFCVKDDKICIIEVKPTSSQKLKKSQRLVMRLLSKYGVPCYKWTPDGGFELMHPDGTLSKRNS